MITDIKPSTRVREIDLVYRNNIKPSDLPVILHSRDAYDLFLESWDMDRIELQEQFRVMLVDNKARCMGVATVSSGGINECLVDLRLVFGLALKGRAASIIVSHNHPSGASQPSTQDILLTERMVMAGRLIGLPVLDHLIVTKEGYTSFLDNNIVLKTARGKSPAKKQLPAYSLKPA